MSSASAVPPTYLCVGPMGPPDTGSSLGHSAVSADVSAASSTGPAYGDAALPHSFDSSVSHGTSCVSCERVRSSVAVPSASFCPAAGSSGSSPGPVSACECACSVTVSVALIGRLCPLCSLCFGRVSPVPAACLFCRLLIKLSTITRPAFNFILRSRTSKS